MMLKVEAILFGFIVREEGVVTAMVSMSMAEGVIELEGPKGAYKRADAPVIVAGITLVLHRTKIRVGKSSRRQEAYIDFYIGFFIISYFRVHLLGNC
jgi:hypothetical protein